MLKQLIQQHQDEQEAKSSKGTITHSEMDQELVQQFRRDINDCLSSIYEVTSMITGQYMALINLQNTNDPENCIIFRFFIHNIANQQ